MSGDDWRLFSPKVINPDKCFARTWAGGQGGQCTRRGFAGGRLCGHHQSVKLGSGWQGEVDGPIPPAKLAEFHEHSIKLSLRVAKKIGDITCHQTPAQRGRKRKSQSAGGSIQGQKVARGSLQKPSTLASSSSGTDSSTSSSNSTSSNTVSRLKNSTGGAVQHQEPPHAGILVRPSTVADLVKLVAHVPVNETNARLSSIETLEELTKTEGIGAFVGADGIKFVSSWLETSLSCSDDAGQASLMLRLLRWLEDAPLTSKHLRGTRLPHVVKRVKEQAKFASDHATRVLTMWAQASKQHSSGRSQTCMAVVDESAKTLPGSTSSTDQDCTAKAQSSTPPCESSSQAAASLPSRVCTTATPDPDLPVSNRYKPSLAGVNDHDVDEILRGLAELSDLVEETARSQEASIAAVDHHVASV